MNFIYSILLFLTLSLISFAIGGLTSGDVHETFFVIGCVMAVATFVFSLVTIFQNMALRTTMRSYFNKIRENLKDKKSIEAEMNKYKEEVTNSLTKLYPDYEKEIFKNINPNDAEHLSALMVKYPELKFNGVLETYTNKMANFINSIHSKDRNVSHCIRRIEDIETCGWIIGSVDKPSFVSKLIEADI